MVDKSYNIIDDQYEMEPPNDLSNNKTIPIRTFVYGLENQVNKSNWSLNHGNDKFKLKGVKLYLDGSPFTGGAAFKEPYENTDITLNRIGLKPNHIGGTNYKLNELIPIIEKYHNKNYQIAIHVQGEIAIDIALEAFNYVL